VLQRGLWPQPRLFYRGEAEECRGHRDFWTQGDRGDQEIPQAADRQRRVFRNTFFGKQLKMNKTGPALDVCFPKKVFLKTLSAPAACGDISRSVISPLSPHSFPFNTLVMKILLKNKKRKRLYFRIVPLIPKSFSPIRPPANLLTDGFHPISILGVVERI